MKRALLCAALAVAAGACGSSDSGDKTTNSGTTVTTSTTTNTNTSNTTGGRSGGFGGSCMTVITTGTIVNKQCIDLYIPDPNPAAIAAKSCQMSDANIKNTYSADNCPITADLLGKCTRQFSTDIYYYSDDKAQAPSYQANCSTLGGTWSTP